MKKIKKIAGALLAFLSLLYFIWFVRDLETLIDYEKLGFGTDGTRTWVWMLFSNIMPIAGLIFAAVYAFSKRLWERRWMLTVAVALMGVFLAFSELMHVNEEYEALPPAVTLAAVGIYIACIYAPKVPNRRPVACAVLAVLTVSVCVLCGVSMGLQFQDATIAFNAVYIWGLTYTMPLVPMALLGLCLPERYD